MGSQRFLHELPLGRTGAGFLNQMSLFPLMELMGQSGQSAKFSQTAVLADFFIFFGSKLSSEPTGSRAGLCT